MDQVSSAEEEELSKLISELKMQVDGAKQDQWKVSEQLARTTADVQVVKLIMKILMIILAVVNSYLLIKHFI